MRSQSRAGRFYVVSTRDARGLKPVLARRVASAGRIGHNEAMAEADARGANAPEITVSELANALKRAIEDRFGYVRVQGRDFRLSRPPFLGPRLFLPEGRQRAARRRHLAHHAPAHAAQARGGARGHRDRATDHLPRQVDLPDRDRVARTRRNRRADGAARGAAQETRRGRAVRRRAQAQSRRSCREWWAW